MSLSVYCIEDARRLARKRLPKIIFDYIDGAAGQETAADLNQRRLQQTRLLPRVLVNVEQRSLVTSILGQDYSLPFGIAPMGMCNLSIPDADRFLAETAIRRGIPLCLSTMASTSIEDVAELTGGNAWFQLYMGQSESRAMTLVDRARASGCRTLVLTVDVPQVAPRLRDLRNGFKAPMRIGPRQFIDFAQHPGWSISTLIKGVPGLANFDGEGFDRDASRGAVDWSFLDRLRQHWNDNLVVKGVLDPGDALRIRQAGVDGIYVSNHGGRQLDSAPAAIDRLPLIREAVGADYPLLFDSGIRSGESVVKALALGADFVMLGRPFLYGLAAGGDAGLNRVIDVLENEISICMAQLGCTDINRINSDTLV